jgi:hypothetical protein
MNVPAYYGLFQMNRNLLMSNNESFCQSKPFPVENANLPAHIDISDRNINTFQETSASAATQASTSTFSSNINLSSRAKRTFVPNEHKDIFYWMKRLKNNVSARRSRVKRKVLEQYMERKLAELQMENNDLKREINMLRKQCECHKNDPPTYDVNQDYGDKGCGSVASSVSESSELSCNEATERDFWTQDKETASSSEETERSSSTEICDEPVEIQRVPHKIRLKLHLHSAFSKH